MVKFRPNDTTLEIIIHRLQIMLSQEFHSEHSGPHEHRPRHGLQPPGPSREPGKRETFNWDLQGLFKLCPILPRCSRC